MKNFKDEISKEVLETLTMEDLYKNPNLIKLVKEKYPRAYLSITGPYREFGLYSFIKWAELQKKFVDDAINLKVVKDSPGKNLKFALKVIKKNKINVNSELWVSGVPFKFELSRFVKHYAREITYLEWRETLKDLGATKSNIDRILDRYKSKFKETD